MTECSPDMKKVVRKYVRFLDQQYRSDEIFDSSLLPFPKQDIIDCSLAYLQEEDNPLIRKTISDSLLSLSFYQEGIGTVPMVNCRFELFPMDLSGLDEGQLGRVRLAVAEHLPHLDGRTFLAALRRVQADFKKLNDACEAIERQHTAA